MLARLNVNWNSMGAKLDSKKWYVTKCNSKVFGLKNYLIKLIIYVPYKRINHMF